VVVPAVVALLPPAGHDQQRVVDGDTQPDQSDEELHEVGEVAQVSEAQQKQERGQDRRGRDDQRQDGEEGGEHERQHGERAHRADDDLGENAVTFRFRSRGKHVEAGDAGRGTGRFRLVQRGADLLGRRGPRRRR